MVRHALLTLVPFAMLAACGDDPPQPAAAGPVVSRAVDEPPGANCPEGGTAVQSGIDADGDGALGDAEVETTVYVCRRDRVRLVPEPAGANCTDGGTAVWVGDDRDGDDVLEENEIRDVVYLCDAVHELLTRLVPDASGAPCPEAGAIQVGHDLDDDGVLDDDEVLVTEYVCGEAIQGYMVIDDETELAFYQGVRAVVGDVIIRGTQLEDVELPYLWFVGGSVSVSGNSALESLRLPQLYRIGKGFSASTNPVLDTIDAPLLRHIGDWLSLVENGQLTAFDLDHADIRGSVTIDSNAALAGLAWDDVEIGGPIEISGNLVLATLALQSPRQLDSLRVLDNPQLTALDANAAGVTGRVEVYGNASLGSLRLQVGTIAGDLWIVDNPVLNHLDSYGALDDRGLYYVGGDLTLTGSPISDFDVGFEYEGLYIAGNAKLANLAVTSLRDDEKDLERVGGNLVVWDNPELTWLRTRAEGGVSIMHNPSLEAAWFFYEGEHHASEIGVRDNPVLEEFDAAYLQTVSGSVTITDNPLLGSLGLTYLQVADAITITNNASMPVCRIQALFDRVTASPEVQSGNDEDGVCP